MRLLVLGGTAWLSRLVAVDAVQRGHEVICAARGESGQVADGAQLVVVDRDRPGALEQLAGSRWDAVVDVTRRRSHARSALGSLASSTAYWLFVSTCSVYADHATPGQTADAPTLQPAGADVDELEMANYGVVKRACEVAVSEALPHRSLLLRPGLIVGPGDPTGRFAYWPHHAATAAELLVPGTPDDAVQLIDVRDLTAWIVTLAEEETTGILDGLGPAMTRAEFVDQVVQGVRANPRLTWVDDDFLTGHDVRPWMGERSIPLWIPGVEYAGFMARDVTRSLAAGLVVRPLAETARDTIAWLESTPGAEITGLTDDEHAAVLEAWARRPA
jgi:nucleoside-diphosphate-sugar epimerase